MEIAKLNVIIKNIQKRNASQTKAIQTALEGVAFHAVFHGNLDPAIRLFEAVGNSTNRTAMSHWLTWAPQNGEKLLPFYFKDDKPALSSKAQKAMATMRREEFEDALKMIPAWHTLGRKENVAKDFDPNEAIRSIVKLLLTKHKKFAALSGADDVCDVLNNAAIKLAAIVNENEFEVAA